jgi:adenylate cyclase class 2
MKRRNEIEIKLKITNRRALRRRLKALGFTAAGLRVHERNVLYDFPDHALAKARCALRLRSAGEGHWLTFKGRPVHSEKYKIREEIETRVGDANQASGILNALRLQPVFVYEKHRTTYTMDTERARGKPPTLALDETAAGDYVELEGPQEWIDRIASQLGFGEADYITASYVSLLLAANRQRRCNTKTAAEAAAGVLVSIPSAHTRRKTRYGARR